MGIIALITAALQAIVALPGLLDRFAAAQEKQNNLQTLALKAKALQDAQAAMTPEDYRNAAKEIHDAIESL